MKELNTSFWVRLSLINLLLVALMGILMRYKIGFEFPFFNQKNIQHAHSHFAFTGWISQTLMVLMVHYLQQYATQLKVSKYVFLLRAHVLCSYGMLIGFFLQGYGVISITFSFLHLILNAWFAINYFKSLKQVKQHPAKKWFTTALVFNLLSSLGTLALIYMMVSKHIPQHQYLASVYFYLHFQYNGWFFFAVMGLFTAQVSALNFAFPQEKKVFLLFSISCLPAYFLSVLWAHLPLWLYPFIVAASVAQLIAWLLVIRAMYDNSNKVKTQLSLLSRYLFLFVGTALTIKFMLQAGSTFPAMSKMAFGFRPIVMAYLHLVLLAILTMFLIGYVYTFNYIKKNILTTTAIISISAGVFLNELILGIQGIAGISYVMIPYVNELLFYIAVLIGASILLLLASQWRKVS